MPSCPPGKFCGVERRSIKQTATGWLAICRAAQEQSLDLYNVREVDSALGNSLETLHASHRAWLAGGGQGPLLVDGAPLEDLCLTFQLPGWPTCPTIAIVSPT